MSVALAAALAIAGSATAGFGLYLTLLALACLDARGSKRARPAGDPTSRLVILVPAHDEEELVGRTVTSLLSQDYPEDLRRVVVIADNCSDGTAAVAQAAGAETMIRTDSTNPGKGRALRWAMDALLDAPAPFDAVVVVDADSTVSAGFLAALERELRAGHAVVQADYTMTAEPGRPRSELIAAGFLLFHRVRFGGRRRLGLPACLVGNGMLFSRKVLVDHPWSAFSGVEDLEETVQLRLSGRRPWFAPDAHVVGAPAASASGLVRQRMRWEGGRFHVIGTRLPELLRAAVARRDVSLLDAALDLATLPLGLLGMIAAAGTVLSALAVALNVTPKIASVPWLIADLAIATFVCVGLVAADAPASSWRALLLAPGFLMWKIAAYARLLRGFDPNSWHRSDRAADLSAAQPRRIEVGGVPIDHVDFTSALDQARDALAGSRLFQVTTVNLDFVARAQSDRSLREIYRRGDLNVADGAPVVWLARLLGAAIPGRVAGADLVPALLAHAAADGRSVFLLGGENGVAALAAARLRELHPTLQVSGTYEPPRAPVESMNNAEILARIAETQPDLLLVALGNPKQERWIDMHRDQLPVKVAIGVGCVLDLIAGRQTRAPRWMQAAGLEWAFRLLHEPTRLAGRYGTDAVWLVILTLRTLRARTTRPRVAEPA